MNAWIPRAWTGGMYFMDDYDPRFGEAFYDCEYAEIDSGHDIHVERPDDFVAAVDRIG